MGATHYFKNLHISFYLILTAFQNGRCDYSEAVIIPLIAQLNDLKWRIVPSILL